MPDLLDTFKQRAEDLVSSINRAGGLRATLEALRRQMAEADRRRGISRAQGEIKRLNQQITEMTTAIGLQAVGLHEAGQLVSPELQPLCQHVVTLKAEVSTLEAELAKLEAQAAVEKPAVATCAQCGRPLPEGATFCPYCGAAVAQQPAPSPAPVAEQATRSYCIYCGNELRPNAKFCARCGQAVQPRA